MGSATPKDPHRATECPACHFSYGKDDHHDKTLCLANLQELVKTHYDRAVAWQQRHDRAQAWWQAHQDQEEKP